MYLKSIELQGFKSFPEKTTLTFKEGITVIIGPNGSGKSNIADAMRWVLGEGSSRNIRGTKMEDIIFGGSETRKPSSFAQVSLTLDNSSGERIPIDYDEVTVTRRYFRGGDSEYAINGKSCRLKDINALFMNTGIGKGGYSVIGQGKIADIVSQKSEDRRAVFEEAAGISKYKFSKNEAQKKLAVTRENLTRLNDINAELASRIGPLERESEKAKRYMDIYEEKRRLDVALWLYDMSELTERIASLRGTYEIYANELEATEAEAERLTAQTGECFDLLQNIKHETEKCNTELSNTQNERAEASNKAAFATAEASHLREKITELHTRAETVAEQLSEAKKRALEKENALISCKNIRAKRSAELDEKEKAFKSVCEKIDFLADQISLLSEQIKDLEAEEIDLRIKLTVTDTSDKNDAEKNAGLSEQLQIQSGVIETLTKELDSAQKTEQAYEEKRKEAEERSELAKEKIGKLEEKLQTARSERDGAEVAYQVAERKAETLKRMEELFEGYSRATRFVMDEYKKGGIRGKIYAPVSQIISVPEKYTTAIECALGSALQNVVVEDEAAAKAAMYALKAAGAGRATFLPVATVRPAYLSQNVNELKVCAGFEGVASELVSCEAKFTDIRDSLLGRTVVFDNIDNAVICARKFGYKIRIVTLDGQQINAGGSFTGGSGVRDSGILSRSREIEEQNKLKEKYKKQSDGAAKTIEALSAELTELKEQKDRCDAEEGILAALANEAKASVMVVRAKLDEANLRFDGVNAEINGVAELAEARRKEREEDEKKRAGLSEKIKESKDRAAELDSLMDEASEEQQRLRAELEAARISAAENERDLSAAETLYNEAKAACEELIAAQSDIAAAINRQKARLDETQTKTTAVTTDISAYDEKIRELTGRIATLSAEAEKAEAKYTQSRRDEIEKNDKKQQLTEKKIQAESKLENAEAEREKLKGVLEENYGLSYVEAKEKFVEYACPEVNEQTRPSLYKRQTELKNKLRALGSVNVNAIEEYAEVKKRHDELSANIEDLSKSEAELNEISERLDREMKQSFEAAFESINEHFGQVFRRLFGGGTAELVLREPDNVLESGIDINVAPPGKIIKSLSLLSGGEQSFVAIAIYLALLEVNPTPFIMLDEIEAALDDVNVDRFARYVQETQDSTQFILITHRRGTMEVAEKMYGITMPVKGISKVLSLDISEIEQKIGKLD